jgi:hypothetical protein
MLEKFLFGIIVTAWKKNFTNGTLICQSLSGGKTPSN